MAPPRHGRRPGLREVSLVWTLYAVVAAEVFATYSRLPAHELYHVSGNGRGGGAARALVFLNWPVALAAIPALLIVAAVARSRAVSRLAVVAGVLCAGVLWPGVVDQSNLDAKWANAIPATGVLLAVVLTVATVGRRGLGPRTSAPGDRARLAIAVVVLLLALPWVVADLGFLIGRWPLFGSFYYSDEWFAPFGHARAHRAVHAGNHHGLVGALLVVTTLLLSRALGVLPPRARSFLGAYLAVLGLYGVANIANDFWLEQVVKRGWTQWELPAMTVPAPTLAWLILLVLAALTYLFFFRGTVRAQPVGDSVPLSALAALPVLTTLLVVGLVHGGTHTRTRVGTADGIVFSAAPGGTSHLFVTRSGHVAQLTSGHGSDLAPAWSPSRHDVAFQSNRDGNWEIYVIRADGTHLRRLTHGGARDGEPGWTPDGTQIAFTRNGALYAMAADGSNVHPLAHPGEWPSWSPRRHELASDVASGEHDYAIVVENRGRRFGQFGTGDNRRPAWSPDGQRLAFECRLGNHWHICVTDRAGGALRVLTPHGSDAFAPAWSPEGHRIAFVSDRDGVDELFVMRPDGTGVVRLTSGAVDVDTPAWSRR